METLNIVELLILWSAIGILLAVALCDSTLEKNRPFFNLYACLTIFGPAVFCAAIIYYVVVKPVMILVAKLNNKY
jgi:hypothetical protein